MVKKVNTKYKAPSSAKLPINAAIAQAASSGGTFIIPLAGGEFVRMHDPSTNKDIIGVRTDSARFLEELMRLAELGEGQLRPKLIKELEKFQTYNDNPNWGRALTVLRQEGE